MNPTLHLPTRTPSCEKESPSKLKPIHALLLQTDSCAPHACATTLGIGPSNDCSVLQPTRESPLGRPSVRLALFGAESDPASRNRLDPFVRCHSCHNRIVKDQPLRFPQRNRRSVLPDRQGADSRRHAPAIKPVPWPSVDTLTARPRERFPLYSHFPALSNATAWRISAFSRKIGHPLDGSGLPRDTMALYRPAAEVQVRPITKTSGDYIPPMRGGADRILCDVGSKPLGTPSSRSRDYTD